MGKVYVLAKQEGTSAIQPTLSSQGMGLMINPSPENVDYTKYGPSNSNQNKLARKFGNIGSKARLGLGALGAMNSFYNATSSGQPGALTAMGSGAMSGYYGSQGLERQAAKQGAKVGVKRDNKESAAAYDEAQADNAMYNAADMFSDTNLPPAQPFRHQSDYSGDSQSKRGPQQVNATSPQFDASQFSEANLPPIAVTPPNPNSPSNNPFAAANKTHVAVTAPPGPNTNNPITSNLQPPQPVAVTGADTKDGSLGKYGKVGVSGGNTQVDNLDPTKLVQAQTDGVDENGNIITGTAKQQG